MWVFFSSETEKEKEKKGKKALSPFLSYLTFNLRSSSLFYQGKIRSIYSLFSCKEYENFVIVQSKAIDECNLTKPKDKCKIRWKSIAVMEKRHNEKKYPYLIKETPKYQRS